MGDESGPPSPVIVSFAGEKVALGPLRRDLVPLYLTWINDFEVTRYLGRRFSIFTLEAEVEWYERAAKERDAVHFTMYDRPTMTPIGTTGLFRLDPENGTGTFGILIGEAQYRGRGYGTEATRLVLDYAFSALGLHNVMLQVLSTNERAIRAYRRAGFREIGRRREALRVGQARCDEVLMECLAAGFESPVIESLLAGGDSVRPSNGI